MQVGVASRPTSRNLVEQTFSDRLSFIIEIVIMVPAIVLLLSLGCVAPLYVQWFYSSINQNKLNQQKIPHPKFPF